MLGLNLRLYGGGAPALDDGTYVVALLGQSNMVGRASFDNGPTHPADAMQWGRETPDNGTIIPASIPLQHRDPEPGDMGPDIGFARRWLAMRPGATLVMVPSADGGTSLQSGFWQKGGTGFEDAVARINAAMAASPDASFLGFLWHQGESDAGYAAYQTDLDQMIADFRNDVAAAGPSTPFVLGGLLPAWTSGVPDREVIQTTISQTPSRVDHTAIASSDGLTSSDGLHFDPASLRTLGERYVSALFLAAASQGNVPLATGTIPDQTDFITTDSGSQTGPEAPAALGHIPDQEDTI